MKRWFWVLLGVMCLVQSAEAKPPWWKHGKAAAASDTLYYFSASGEVAFPAPGDVSTYRSITLRSHLGTALYVGPALGVYQEGVWIANIPAMSETNRPGPFATTISSVTVPQFPPSGVEFMVKLYPDLDHFWGSSPDLPAPRWVGEIYPQ